METNKSFAHIKKFIENSLPSGVNATDKNTLEMYYRLPDLDSVRGVESGTGLIVTLDLANDNTNTLNVMGIKKIEVSPYTFKLPFNGRLAKFEYPTFSSNDQERIRNTEGYEEFRDFIRGLFNAYMTKNYSIDEDALTSALKVR